MWKSVVAALTMIAVLVPGAAFADMAVISGTVTYRERIALPPDASVEVRLVDVSLADAPSKMLAETRIAPQGQVPIPFTLEYDRSAIAAGRTYALQADIRAGGRLWFTTATHHPFDSEQAESHEIVLTRASDAASPAGSWVLESLRGEAVHSDVESTMELAEDGTLSGSGGCNRMLGKATIDGSSIGFGNIASTQMACPEDAMEQEGRFFAALGDARQWRIDPTGSKLVLLGEQGDPVIVFHRQ